MNSKIWSHRTTCTSICVCMYFSANQNGNYTKNRQQQQTTFGALSFTKFTRLPIGRFSLVLINLNVFFYFSVIMIHTWMLLLVNLPTRIFKYECTLFSMYEHWFDYVRTANVSKCLNVCLGIHLCVRICVHLDAYISISFGKGVSEISGPKSLFRKESNKVSKCGSTLNFKPIL